jgi:hypothetical protein
MNSTTTQANGTGGNNWIVFLFGAMFNVLANVKLSFLLDYMLQALVGGLICLVFKIIGDVLSPLWLKHRDRIKNITKIKSFKRRKRDTKHYGKD